MFLKDDQRSNRPNAYQCIVYFTINEAFYGYITKFMAQQAHYNKGPEYLALPTFWRDVAHLQYGLILFNTNY